MLFNVVTGMPRSGSTLLCNLLNQAGNVYASPTSPLAELVSHIVDTYSNIPETAHMLADSRISEHNMSWALQGFVEGFYGDPSYEIVFDKGRGWTHLADIFHHVWDEGVMLCCIRNPYDVLESIIRHDRKNPVLNFDNQPRKMSDKISVLTDLGGLLGSSIRGVMTAWEEGNPNLLIAKYEDWSENPDRLMLDYRLPAHNWQYDRVVDVTTEVDEIYLNKFPHVGEGRIRRKHHAETVLPSDTDEMLREKFPLFYETFYPERGGR